MSDSEIGAAAPEKKEKGGIIGLLVLILIAVAIAAGLFFFKKQHDSIVNYAPDGTSLIVYFNAQKFNENKIWNAAKELFKDDYAKFEKDAEKEGIVLDEVLKSQTAVFLNLKDTDKISGAGVVAFQEKIADKYFKLIAEKCKDDKKVSAREIEGKPGLEVKDGEGGGYLVEASENMFQLAGGAKYDGRAALLKKTATAIAGKVYPDSIFCIVLDYKTLNLPADFTELLKAYNAEELINGLNFVTLSIKENKNKIESRLEFTYENSEQAAKAGETVKALVVLGKKAASGVAAKHQDQENSKKTREMLERLEVKVENNSVILSSAEDMDDIIAQMKANSKSFKEAAKDAGALVVM